MSTGRNGVPRRDVLKGVGAGSIAALAGCTGGDGGGSDEESPPEPETVSVSADAIWRTASLTDVTTGEEYRIGAFDRPVIVHTFATGCAVCQSQHMEFDDFYSNADVEIVDLTIDPNDGPEKLRSYAEKEGYGWRFGTAPDEVTSALSSDFGREVYSSASSPVIIDCHADDHVYTLEKKVEGEHLTSVLGDVCGSNGSSDSSNSNNSSDSNDSSA